MGAARNRTIARMKKIIFLFIAVLLIIYWQAFSPPSKTSENAVFIKISAGQTLKTTAEDLKNKNLIRSTTAFNLYAKFLGVEEKIQPGRYGFKEGIGIKEILNTITNTELTEINVTVPEGFSVREIDKRLTEMGLIFKEEFESAALMYEGYLFPDTYSVYKYNFSPDALVKKMRDNFLKKITPDLLAEIKKQKRELKEIITMASILEKEIKTEKDMAVVAGILLKRLDNDWPLQADATLLYGKDLYDTYKNRGLPPTPIGNPGIKTIRAAIFPEKSDYWFYLTDKEGNVHYAKSNEEQNENRKKYL